MRQTPEHGSRSKKTKRTLLLKLEPRILFDGAAVADALAAVASDVMEAADTAAPTPAAIDVPQASSDTVTTAESAAPTTPDASQPIASDVSTDLFAVAETSPVMAESVTSASQAIRDFIASADDAMLFALFGGGRAEADSDWNERLATLRTQIADGTLQIDVVEMDGASQFTAIAAYTRAGPDGQPAIFINRYWFDMFDAPDATRALVEEFGHAIDDYLNPDADTAGDEGEAFADRVIDGSVSSDTLASLAMQGDQGTVVVNGVSYDVEFASFNFVNAYEMVYDRDNDTLGRAAGQITTGDIDTTERWADKEQNLQYFNASNSLGTVGVVDGTNNQNFSGNDVSATAIVIGGTTHYGWISRPIKDQGIVRGFYFWTDVNFTSFTIAQSDGNTDGDRNILDNRGFLLVVDQDWFTSQINATKGGSTVTINNTKDGNLGSIWVANLGSSSDRVDTALNSLIVPNSAPTAVNDSATVAEDGTLTKTATTGLLANDTDANNDSLTITTFSVGGVSTTVDSTNGGTYNIANVGSIRINKDGSYTFTPVANYNGSVPPITYTVSDGKGGTATAVLSITVTPVNDAPDAVNDNQTVTEDTPASGNVLGNDTDPESDPLTVTGFSIAGESGTFTIGTPYVITGKGTLTLNANGTYSFVPASNYTGAIPVITYTISDGNGGTDTATLTLTMSATNDAPIANPDNADGTLSAQAPGCLNGSAVTETQQTGNVLTNDTDPDITLVAGTTHQVTAVTSGTGNTWSSGTITGKYGVLTIGANGAYSYNVNENNADVIALASGATLSETFNYTVSEIGNTPNLTASSTLQIVIKGANNAPVAMDDYNTVIERSSSTTNTVNGSSANTYGTATGDVSTNDTDTDSTTRTVTNVSSPTVYNYSTDFGSNTNAIKSYLNTTYVTKVEYTTDATPTGSSTWSTLLNTNGTNCSVSGYDASSGFKIFLTNQTALSGYQTGGTVRITLSGAGQKDGTYTGSYSGFTTTAGTSTAISSGSSAWLAGKYGSVNLSSTGGYTYYLTSTALAVGESYEEQFTYTTTDGSCTATAVLHITANGTTTLTMDNEAVTTAEDTTYTSDANSNLLNGDTGFNSSGTGATATPYVSNFTWGGSTITVGTTADHSAQGTKTISGVGTLTVNGDGSYSFTPASNYSGPVPTATYTATDGTNSAQATLSITITSANDASALTADTRTVPEDGGGSGNVLDNDTDADNTLSVASYTWNNGSGTSTGTVGTATTITSGGVTAGSLTLGSNGAYTFTPAANWNGTVPTITYTTNTGSTSTLAITVTPANDLPTLDLDGSGAGTGWNTTYTNQGTSVSIGDTDVAVVDIDDANIESAVIVLTNPQSGDTLNVGTLPNGITVTSGPTLSNGVLTLTLGGSATKANYEAAIEAITFSSTGNSTATRTVSVVVNDGDANSNTAYTNIAVSADNRLVTVMGSVVNEASPYVMFEVTGAENQWISLELGQTSNANGNATTGTDFLPNLQYFNGTAWTSYTGGLIKIPDTAANNGKLLVRTAVLQDSTFETTSAGYETLKLTAKNAAGTANAVTGAVDTLAEGMAQIRDDGQGSIFLGNNNGTNNASAPNTTGDTDPNGPDYPTYLDDDRPVTVNNIAVNEGSPWAMFTVTGSSGQKVSLALLDGTAKVGDGTPADGSEDYSPTLQYWDGSAWTTYNGTSVTLNGATLLVRTAIHQDTLFEGQHTFSLGVTKLSSNTTVYGTCDIYDDGTGSKYAFDNNNDGTATITTGPGAGFDDDRTLTVDSPTVNEASDYVVFTLTGNSGQTVSLSLVDESNNGTVTGKANINENQTLKIWNGLDWVDYNANNLPAFDGNGKVFVRVNIIAEQDTPREVAETFKLNATLTGRSTSVAGTATIKDDGTGVKYPGTFTNGVPNTNTNSLDNDLSGADLSIAKSVNNQSPILNGEVIYTLVVTNHGDGTAVNARVTDQLPAGLTFVSATATQGSYNSGTGQWTIGNLVNGATSTLNIKATVNSLSPINNVASVTSDTPDSTPGNNTDNGSNDPGGNNQSVTPHAPLVVSPGAPLPPVAALTPVTAAPALSIAPAQHVLAAVADARASSESPGSVDLPLDAHLNGSTVFTAMTTDPTLYVLPAVVDVQPDVRFLAQQIRSVMGNTLGGNTAIATSSGRTTLDTPIGPVDIAPQGIEVFGIALVVDSVQGREASPQERSPEQNQSPSDDDEADKKTKGITLGAFEKPVSGVGTERAIIAGHKAFSHQLKQAAEKRSLRVPAAHLKTLSPSQRAA